MSSSHLGGWVAGGDPATWFPDLWQWFMDELEVTSVIDLGCGSGVSTRWFRDNCMRVLGVEGDPPPTDLPIFKHDFTTGPFFPGRDYDLCWCCEFLEHVEEQYLPNVLTTIVSCKIVALTHAFPGQPGHHHVNCREPEYWKGVMAAAGYRLDQNLTDGARWMAEQNTFSWEDDEGAHVNHFLRSGLVFVRSGD